MSQNQIMMVVDRSGSMSGSEAKTVEAINGFVSQMQQDSLGKSASFTLMTFDSQGFDVIRRGTVSEVKPLENKEFSPRAATNLYDAVGYAIGKMASAEKNMLVILTDGMENASKNFKTESIRALIEEKRKAGWIILYIGANIDAWKQAENIGIPGNQAMNFKQSGTQVPSQPGNPGLWSRFKGRVSQNPIGYALGAAALLGLAYMALRPGNAQAAEALGFTDADRNASMGVDGVGNNNWQHAVNDDIESFDEPIKTDSIFDPGLSQEAAQSAAELPDDFDPTLGSMVDGKQAVDTGSDILAPEDVPSSEDFVSSNNDGPSDGSSEESDSTNPATSSPTPEPDLWSRESSPAPEPEPAYESPSPSYGGGSDWDSRSSGSGSSSDYDSDLV